MSSRTPSRRSTRTSPTTRRGTSGVCSCCACTPTPQTSPAPSAAVCFAQVHVHACTHPPASLHTRHTQTSSLCGTQCTSSQRTRARGCTTTGSCSTSVCAFLTTPNKLSLNARQTHSGVPGRGRQAHAARGGDPPVRRAPWHGARLCLFVQPHTYTLLSSAGTDAAVVTLCSGAADQDAAVCAAQPRLPDTREPRAARASCRARPRSHRLLPVPPYCTLSAHMHCPFHRFPSVCARVVCMRAAANHMKPKTPPSFFSIFFSPPPLHLHERLNALVFSH